MSSKLFKYSPSILRRPCTKKIHTEFYHYNVILNTGTRSRGYLKFLENCQCWMLFFQLKRNGMRCEIKNKHEMTTVIRPYFFHVNLGLWGWATPTTSSGKWIYSCFSILSCYICTCDAILEWPWVSVHRTISCHRYPKFNLYIFPKAETSICLLDESLSILQ